MLATGCAATSTDDAQQNAVRGEPLPADEQPGREYSHVILHIPNWPYQQPSIRGWPYPRCGELLARDLERHRWITYEAHDLVPRDVGPGARTLLIWDRRRQEYLLYEKESQTLQTVPKERFPLGKASEHGWLKSRPGASRDAMYSEQFGLVWQKGWVWWRMAVVDLETEETIDVFFKYPSCNDYVISAPCTLEQLEAALAEVRRQLDARQTDASS
jgi:hypothetical protein